MKMKKYSGVLKRVREIEEKRGIEYARIGGKLYKGLKVVHILSASWALLMNLFFLLSIWINFAGEEKMPQLQGLVLTVAVCSLGLILGFVLTCFKINIAGAVSSLASSVMLIVTYGREMSDALGFWGFKPSFYWRHLIPLVLAAITIIWMVIIAVRERINTNKLYKKVSEGLYEEFKKNSENTDDEWEEFLKNYNA
jgi:glycerol-3-phosphate acyltransferase PlsY